MKKTILIIFILFSLKSYSQCNIPTALITSNITFTNAIANWSAVSNAYKYTIKYRVCGTSNWSSLQVFSPDSTRNIPSLQQSTCYEWTIRAFCDSTNNQIRSDWSDTISFTTPAFVYSTFNPIVTNTLDTTHCKLHTSISLNITQTPYEPDIQSSTVTSNGGYFDLASISSGDSVGSASITTNSQTINAVLYATTVFTNYAIIIANDSTGSAIGFFTIENLTTGIKVSATSPPDGNDYTSGLTSYVAFTDIFVTPDYAGVLSFFTDIESERNDQIYDTTNFIISCETNIEDINKSAKKIIATYDFLGKQTKEKESGIYFYLYSDGTVEKKLIITNPIY